MTYFYRRGANNAEKAARLSGTPTETAIKTPKKAGGNCAFFPFGTALGIFTIIVLTRIGAKAL